MFVAHMPAAYLLSLGCAGLRQHHAWFLTGSVLPDLDMLVFWGWHAGAVHHHSYLTHRPAFWAMLLVLAWLLHQPQIRLLCQGALVHLVLDSVAGQIAWGWPPSFHTAALVEVPATQDWWVMSFLLHWTFGVELAICLAALICWRHRVRQRRPLRDTS